MYLSMYIIRQEDCNITLRCFVQPAANVLADHSSDIIQFFKNTKSNGNAFASGYVAVSVRAQYIVSVLRGSDDIEKDSPSPRFLVKNWPPAFTEWDTKSVRDAFFASPLFPRLLNATAIKETIARGVTEGLLAYVGKVDGGNYSPFIYKKPLDMADVVISDDMFIIKSEEAEKHIQPPVLTRIIVTPSQVQLKPETKLR